jgi:hypothetical protein
LVQKSLQASFDKDLFPDHRHATGNIDLPNRKIQFIRIGNQFGKPVSFLREPEVQTLFRYFHHLDFQNTPAWPLSS